MSGPWDDYKPPQESSGPWDNYKKSSTLDGIKDQSNVSDGAIPTSQPYTETWSDKHLPWWANYSHMSLHDGFPGQPFESGDDTSSITTKALDMFQAGRRSLAGMAAGVVDTALHPILTFTSSPETPASNFVDNLFDKVDGPPTAQEQTYEGNAGKLFNALDPQMLMPYAHPTTPGIGDYIASRGPRVPSSSSRLNTLNDLSNRVEDGPWKQYASQDELPFTNNVEDMATSQNARGNQGDLFNDNQGLPATPYNPNGRIPDDAQNELPLTNSVQDVANQASNPNGQLDMFGGAQNQVSVDPMNSIPEITPQIALRKALDAEDAGKQAEAAFWRERAMEMVRDERAKQAATQEPIHINDQGTASDPATMDALTRSTEGITYENVPPDGVIPRDSKGMEVPKGNNWTTDENGIPVRQGLPTSSPDLSTTATVQGILNSDKGARDDLGNAIQEANGPKLGPDDLFGSEPIQTESQPFNNLIKASGPRAKQRGSIQTGIDPEAVRRAIAGTKDLVGKTIDGLTNIAKVPLRRIVGMLPEDHMARVPGMKDLVYKPKPGEEFLQQALTEGRKNPSIAKNFQSGALLAGEKWNSAALKGIGSWLQWADKRTVLDNRNVADPIQAKLNKLPENVFQDLHKIMMQEQLTGRRFADEHLSQVMSPKMVEAYQGLRKAFDDAWTRSVKTRQDLGLPPIKKEEAYHASMRNGDWKQAFYDKNGKLVWHVASESKIAGMKAEAFLRKTIGDKIDWDRSKIDFTPDHIPVGIPRDILSSYHEMLKFFDPKDVTTSAISDAISKYNLEHGLEVKDQNQRFLNKSGIPGFEGNKPWLSDKENAHSFMTSQMNYLRNSNHWNNFQEALSNMQPMLKNEELVRNQPNIMKYAAALVSKEMGISPNIFKDLERGLARMMPKIGMVDGVPKMAFGTSRGNLYKGVADLKTGTYLAMLGTNVGYMITTPIQSLVAVAQHRLLSSEGYSHNVAKTLVNSIIDTTAGLSKHFLSSMTGKDINTPVSAFGKRAMQYAEDNGILDKTVMDESGGLRPHGVVNAVMKVLGPTVTAPEKIARFSTFMGFAHHLMDSGKLSEAEAFQKAEDFTNHSLTSMRRSDRPMIVDKLGATGQLAYVFKSYLFNEYNQLSQFAIQAKKGNATPLLTHLGMLYALGGALSLPLINELDSGWNMAKDLMAKEFPQAYQAVSGLGIKGTLLKDMPTWASIGTVSQVTGTSLGNRFSTQIGDPSHIGEALATPVQEAKELGGIAKPIVNPTKRNVEQAVYANGTPLLKGIMETHLDDFKNGPPNDNGTQSYRRARDINDVATDYKRTPNDESKRQLGLYSTDEYKTRQLRYINNQEQGRVGDAYNESVKRALTAGVDGDRATAQKYARNALQLIPDQAKFESMLQAAAEAHGMTPEEREEAKAQSMKNLERIRRLAQ